MPECLYAWEMRPVSARQIDNERLLCRIRQIHADSQGILDAAHVHEDLVDEGKTAGKNRSARLMAARQTSFVATYCFESVESTQFRSNDYQLFLKRNMLVSSMSAVGHCGDNAACEGFLRNASNGNVPTMEDTGHWISLKRIYLTTSNAFIILKCDEEWLSVIWSSQPF